MSAPAAPLAPLEMWGGIEYTVNRVGDRWFDQMARSGHDRRPDDLQRFAALGIRALRYPVLWERLAPRSLDEIDWRWTDHRLARLRHLGLRPIVGMLHHGSGPAYTSLLDDGFAEKLARFAGAVARRYPWLTDFTPVNEPLTTARFSGLYGHWYPHGSTDREYVRALLNQVRGVALAMREIRAVIPGARLVQTEDCGRTFGTRPTRQQVTHEAQRRWLTWDLLTGRVDDRHPLHDFLVRSGMTTSDQAFFLDANCRPDVLGLNYYLTSDRYLDHRLDDYPLATHGGNGYSRYADVEAVRARPDGLAGHEAHLRAAWNRYRIPVAITEVHLACTRDEQMRWLVESWRGAQRARAEGADVRAVTAWALLGSYDWDSLVTRDAGRYEPGVFDVRSPVPRPTALAAVVRTLAAGGEPRHPALAGTPWWRRPDRMIRWAARRTPAWGTADPPVLIIGSTGTLGYAFQRICEQRGLASRLVGRHEVDITDAARVDAILRRLQPWAIVNAAGYVRVDDAERDPEACRRANVAGPVNLAAACRRRDLPLVTFSSDLVFDGRLERAYVEDDVPRPLNVYGATKAEAERRVRELLPGALVIRTSAFFGPWDEYNFLACLFRTLDSGAPFMAPADSTVSPTYVPDLVNATLDLLIDGEHGLWHLANEGAVTWYEFARRAAERGGRPAEGVVPVETAQVWGPAIRPRFSALSSRRGQLLRSLDEALGAYLYEARAARAAAGASGVA
jgi:dTDP-4-dehydrorhamnose reductase